MYVQWEAVLKRMATWLVPDRSIELIRASGFASAVIVRHGRRFVPAKSIELNVNPTVVLAAVRYRFRSAPTAMFDTNTPASGNGNETGPSTPLLVNCPSDRSPTGFSTRPRSCQATPSIVGAVGLPVPSAQPSEVSQRISKAPIPRLKIPLFGAPISVTSSVAPVTTQPLLPNDPFSDAATPDIGNRSKVSSSPFCWPDPFTASDPDTDKAPAAP